MRNTSSCYRMLCNLKKKIKEPVGTDGWSCTLGNLLPASEPNAAKDKYERTAKKDYIALLH